jgi:hypothetical protein
MWCHLSLLLPRARIVMDGSVTSPMCHCSNGSQDVHYYSWTLSLQRCFIIVWFNTARFIHKVELLCYNDNRQQLRTKEVKRLCSLHWPKSWGLLAKLNVIIFVNYLKFISSFTGPALTFWRLSGRLVGEGPFRTHFFRKTLLISP